MESTMKTLLRTAIALSIASSALGQATGDDLRRLIEQALPPEVGDIKIVEDMLRPSIGPQLSKNWEIRNAFRAFADKLAPTDECFLDTKPGGDPSVPTEDCTYTNGDRNGRDPASMLRFSLAEGRIKYLNRGRELNPNSSENKLSQEEAKKGSLELAKLLGIPTAEIALDFIDATDIIATASSADERKPDTIRKRMEVLTTLPRCMPVNGNALNDCVPVFNSGLRIALSTGNRGPQASWLNGVWPDFELAPVDGVLSRSEVIEKTVAALDPQTLPNSLSKLQIFIAYAQNAELTGQEGHDHCSAMEADEKDPDPNQPDQRPVETPADLVAARQFVPSIVVYALPHELDEGAIDPRQQTVSTGIPVLSIPLVKSDASEC